VRAHASHHASREYAQLAREILEEAKETDRRDDELYGERRGDELPLELATVEGRRGWLREAKQRLQAERDANPKPVPRSRPARVKEAKCRLEEELWTDHRANDAYEAYRARGEAVEPVFANMKFNRRFDRFQRRGRSACHSEWRLIDATHNLLTLHTALQTA